jgi:hypothetical protein
MAKNEIIAEGVQFEKGKRVEVLFKLRVIYDRIDNDYCVQHSSLGCSKPAKTPSQAAVLLLSSHGYQFISVWE